MRALYVVIGTIMWLAAVRLAVAEGHSGWAIAMLVIGSVLAFSAAKDEPLLKIETKR